MNRSPALFLAATTILAGVAPARADETVQLLCNFKYGQLEVSVNYTRETVNGATAMITDKEIVWTPPGKNQGLAIVNRYTGIMEISRGRESSTGVCRRKAAK